MSSPRIGVHDPEFDGTMGKPGDRLRNRRRPRFSLVAGFVAVVAPVILDPVLRPRRNCGGNSRVMSYLRFCLDFVHARECREVNPTRWREELADLACRVRPARFLVPADFERVPRSGPRRVVIVCDTPYDNIPQRIWFPGTPRHVVGYSDGTLDLIPVDDCRALDLSTFRPLDELFPESRAGGESDAPAPQDPARSPGP